MPSRSRIVLAFAAVYVIWGSTYLGIRYAIETLPPMVMAGTRFILAGASLYAFARARGAAQPARRHWGPAVLTGALMLLGGNGGVVLAERTVDSGLAALIIASVPLWVALFGAFTVGGSLPRGRKALALVMGFAGVALLVAGRGLGGGNLGGMVLLVAAAASWAVGSLYSRTAPRPASALMATALQMLCGGVLQLVAATALGEWGQLRLDQVSIESGLAFAYLVLFGSLLGYTAYAWLLQVVSPTLAATYAFVNPVVAVFLGWLVAGEVVTWRTLVAAAIVVASVVLITTAPRSKAG
jgi:drug/metabolite transporter (DMT)-like permease